MYVNNTNEKIYLYELRTNKSTGTDYWACTREFSEKNTLINFLADSVSTHGYDDSSCWTSEYFDKINVTESDTYTWESLTWVMAPSGMRFPMVKSYRDLLPYHFETKNGASVDVRNFK